MHKPVIIGQEARAQVTRENNVEGVTHGNVVPEPPRCVGEGPHRHSTERPSVQPSPCSIGLFLSDVPLDLQLPTGPGEHLYEEMLWNPRSSATGDGCGQPATASGVKADLDTRRGVYNDVAHPSASSRTARIVAAASMLSSAGSGPANSSSMNARNASGELSASGLVTTISGSVETAELLRDMASG